MAKMIALMNCNICGNDADDGQLFRWARYPGKVLFGCHNCQKYLDEFTTKIDEEKV